MTRQRIAVRIKSLEDVKAFFHLATQPRMTEIRSIELTLNAHDFCDYEDDLLAMAFQRFQPDGNLNPHKISKIVIKVDGTILFTRQNYTVISPVASWYVDKKLEGLLSGKTTVEEKEEMPFSVLSQEKAFVSALLGLRGVVEVQITGKMEQALREEIIRNLTTEVGQPVPVAPTRERLAVSSIFWSKSYDRKRAHDSNYPSYAPKDASSSDSKLSAAKGKKPAIKKAKPGPMNPSAKRKADPNDEGQPEGSGAIAKKSKSVEKASTPQMTVSQTPGASLPPGNSGPMNPSVKRKADHEDEGQQEGSGAVAKKSKSIEKAPVPQKTVSQTPGASPPPGNVHAANPSVKQKGDHEAEGEQEGSGTVAKELTSVEKASAAQKTVSHTPGISVPPSDVHAATPSVKRKADHEAEGQQGGSAPVAKKLKSVKKASAPQKTVSQTPGTSLPPGNVQAANPYRIETLRRIAAKPQDKDDYGPGEHGVTATHYNYMEPIDNPPPGKTGKDWIIPTGKGGNCLMGWNAIGDFD